MLGMLFVVSGSSLMCAFFFKLPQVVEGDSNQFLPMGILGTATEPQRS